VNGPDAPGHPDAAPVIHIARSSHELAPVDLSEWCATGPTAILTAMSSCVPNIGPGQRRRRLVFGLISLIIAAVLAAVLAAAEASIVVRAVVALPLYASALGFFQHREKT
jgi:riboflavin transporter FmnP